MLKFKRSTNITSTIDHEEATIRSYMRDPEFAEYMLHMAIAEGDIAEAQKIQRRMLEAWKRTDSRNTEMHILIRETASAVTA